MSDWKKTLEEKRYPEGLESRVLKAARPILEGNREHAEAEPRWYTRPWLFLGAPTLAAAAFAVVWLQGSGSPEPFAAEADALGRRFEIAVDFELYRDYQEIENLRLLQRLGDPAKWPKPAKRSKS